MSFTPVVWCAGTRRGTPHAAGLHCFEAATYIVQAGRPGALRYVAITASDRAGRALYLTIGGRMSV